MVAPFITTMASGSNFSRDAEEESEEPVISMVDYLKEEEELENDAHAVLGGSDEHHCTYPKGYVSRQALYACSTCTSASKTPAGICLACSYDCHEGHDLYELYTKRNFRCDCGNEKFGDLKCKLYPDKADYNTENHYNQNFDGLYCTCARPYPDPEDEIEDEMIQCIICEDWYHGRHLGSKPPVDHDYQEMICGGCLTKHDFLWAYTTLSKETVKLQATEEGKAVDVEQTDKNSSSTTSQKTADTEKQQTDSSSTGEPATQQTDTNESSSSSKETEQDKDKVVASVGDKKSCLLKELQQREITVKDCATFWSEGFRDKLCTCSDCMNLYKEHGLSYLPDETDTVAVYEKRGLEKKTPSTQQDRERRALEGMNHTQQIEMLQGFNDMKTELSEYLKHFAENGKVVREEDIREFFTRMESRKRQRTNNIPGYFCK